MDYEYGQIMKAIEAGQTPLVAIHIEREEVERKDFKRLDRYFNVITLVGKPLRQHCMITISGYDDIPDELFEIKEVTEYAKMMFDRYPYLLYYMTKMGGAHEWLLSCYADEVNALRRAEDRLNVYEVIEKYGIGNNPEFQVHLTFKNRRFGKIMKAITIHGKRQKDALGAKRIAEEYEKQFSDTE